MYVWGSRIRPSILAIWIIVPGLTVLVLFLHGSFDSTPTPLEATHTPVDPEVVQNACPADGAAATARSSSEYAKVAPPYTGSGPHAVVLVEVATSSDADQGYGESTELPLKWGANSQHPQLLLCEYKHVTSETASSCSYRGGPGTLAVLRVKYNYGLFEAKSAKLLTQFKIDGSGCPGEITWEADKSPPRYVEQPADLEALEKALRPFVERHVK
jgi:hypothetical protein